MVFSLPLFLFSSSGVQNIAVLVCLESGSRKMCPASRILLVDMIVWSGVVLHRLSTASFVTLSLHVIFRIRRKQL